MIEKVSEASPTAKVLWDAMPDLEEESSAINQVLQRRMDIDVELFENYHDTIDNNEDADNYMNLNVDDNDSDEDIDSNEDSDDGEERVLDYGTDSSDSD